MRPSFLLPAALSSCLAAALISVPAVAAAGTALQAAIASPARSAKFRVRDAVRHPAEELAFFGVRPDATVVEIWPGGGYWTEILAPYLQSKGTLYEALPVGLPDENGGVATLRAKLAADPARFGKIKPTGLGPSDAAVAPAGSADFVLTFRNVHNWMGDGYAPKAFAAFYQALKPGGILGVEEHRGDPSTPQDPKADDGYVRQDAIIALATAAGFHLVGSSDMDANPRDTKHWPKGVWTLPPTLALGQQDRARYIAIGEADNAVLKFQK